MKKELLAVFIVVMLVSGVTACAGNASEKDEKAKFEAINDAVGQSESAPDYYKTDDGFTFQDTDGGVALFMYEGEEESVVVPETYQGKDVVELGMACFSMYTNGSSTLKNVSLPDCLNVIGESAFGSCPNLTSVNIPERVTEIGYQAFANCTSLESITIPGSVTVIGNNAFIYCENLTSVEIGDGVTEIGEKAFKDCKSLEQVAIPGSVTKVGRWAFDECTNLKSVTIGDGVTQMDDYVFGDCTNLTRVTLPDSVTVLGRAFHGCDDIVVTYKGVIYTDDNIDDLYKRFEAE